MMLLPEKRAAPNETALGMGLWFSRDARLSNSEVETIVRLRLVLSPMRRSQRNRVSAGLLLFRRTNGKLEVLLVHPGGPFFATKDEGAWSIPKGEALAGEDLLARARSEFEEELGVCPSGNWLDLGSIKQKGGKTVHAWALEGDLPDAFQLKSNTFEMEWPPRSGRVRQFPEIDRAEFFAEEIARRKINAAQRIFLDRLRAALQSRAN